MKRLLLTLFMMVSVQAATAQQIPMPSGIVVSGYQPLGGINYGNTNVVSVEAFEQLRGNVRSKGINITVLADNNATGIATIALADLPSLLLGIDHIIAIQTNPTTMRSFSAEYATRDAALTVSVN